MGWCDRSKVGGIGALGSPIQPIYAGFIGVGVRLSESKPHRRRRAGYVHLRRLATPAGPGSGRPVWLVHTPAFLGLALTRLVGLPLWDVVHTRDGNCLAGVLRGSPCPGSSPSWDFPASSLRPSLPASPPRLAVSLSGWVSYPEAARCRPRPGEPTTARPRCTAVGSAMTPMDDGGRYSIQSPIGQRVPARTGHFSAAAYSFFELSGTTRKA